jgi:hypothetical protein
MMMMIRLWYSNKFESSSPTVVAAGLWGPEVLFWYYVVYLVDKIGNISTYFFLTAYSCITQPTLEKNTFNGNQYGLNLEMNIIYVQVENPFT